MKKLVLLLIFLIIYNHSYANSDLVTALQEGKKLVFIRHALAPGGGDPENFDLDDCSTQRNLDSSGISQAKKIGQFFNDNNIKIDQVLSSEWCRSQDTAKNAFKYYKTFNALNSFFSSKFAKNKDKQMKDLKAFVKKWDSKKKDNNNNFFIILTILILKI